MRTKEGTKEGSKVRESVAFRVRNSRVWAGLQGGCVSAGGRYWLKYDLALFHLGDVTHSLGTQTHAHSQGIN